MNRLLAILLIPLFVVGNSFAHSRCFAAHPFPSQMRAHIHVGSGWHHDHSDHGSHGHSHHGHHHDHDQDGDRSHSAPVAPVDHDSNAVYLVAADSLFTTSERCSFDLDFLSLRLRANYEIAVASWPARFQAPPLSYTSELPLYLLHAALRL